MKFFVASDVHGFFNLFKEQLDEKGFEQNNEEHMLIICGDLLDRGREPQELIKFLQETNNKVLIRGNHEDLFVDCYNRGYFMSHDYSNGTAQSMLDLAPSSTTPQAVMQVSHEKFNPIIKQTVNYFESKKYIFVHGWIPVITDKKPVYYIKNREFSFNLDWRIAHEGDWEQARWLNGMDMANRGFIETNKTIVCGHWHTSWGHSISSNGELPEWGESAVFDPYYADGIICLDGCTAYSNKVNVVVLEDELLENNIV